MKKSLRIGVVTIASILLTVGIVHAASEINVTSQLGGTSGDYFDVDGTLTVNSLKVGTQGSGGVTFFNGTILNNTTGTGSSDNPVTFGDNVRIDGRVYRGATAGTSDTLPFIVNDNLEVAGSITSNGAAVARKKVYEGTIDLTQAGDEVVRSVEQPCVTSSDAKYTRYHYKKISAPEIDIENMANVELYIKPTATGVASNPELWANGGNVWYEATIEQFSDGYAYLRYKYITEYCNGTFSSDNNLFGGEYKLVVIY